MLFIMKKNLLILCALLLTAVGASAQSSWTAPTLPTSTLVSGGEYYLYNTEAGQFMGNASLLWGSEAAFSETGFLATLTYDNGNGGYTIYNNGINGYTGNVFRDANYLYVDGSSTSDATNYARRFFTFTAANGGTYTIHTAWSEDAYSGYLGYDGTTEIKTTLASSDTGIYWVLIAESSNFDIDLYHALVILYNTLVHAESYGMTDSDEAYAAAGTVYLSSDATVEAVMEAVAALEIAMEGLASEADPDEVTYAYITNPSFDASTSDITGWTAGAFWYQSTPHANEDITISGYAETWTAASNNGKLDNTALSQTLTLPKGTYRLEADAVATQQDNASLVVSGVYLCAGSQMTSVHTGNGLPEHYTVEFYVTNENGESADIGMKVYNTDANWVAVDNFVLYYLGEEVTAVTDTESEYKKGDAIDIDGTTYYVQCDNMVENHSFELGFDGWTEAVDYATGITFTNFELRSDEAKDGEVYLVGTTNDGASGTGSLGTAWAIEKDKTYYFSYWVKALSAAAATDPTDGVNGAYLKVSVTSETGSETEKLSDGIHVGEEWQQVEVLYTNTDNYAYIQVDFRWLNNQWAFDNFQLYEIDKDLLPVDWTMTDAGWGTLILPFAATLPDEDNEGKEIEWTAYSTGTVTSDEDDATLSLTEVMGGLAANTPYIIGGTAGTYTFKGTPVEATNGLTAGLLTGTFVDMDYNDLIALDGTVYLLQNHGDDGGVAFYPVVEDLSVNATLTPYHCYLKDSSANGVRGFISFPGSDNEETAIVAVESEEAEGNGAIYDLSGRRVSKAVKGVYIQNGKKVLVK